LAYTSIRRFRIYQQPLAGVRIPAELRLPDGVKKVDVRAKGNERIISPVGQTWDSFFLDGPKVSDDFIEHRASQDQSDREAF
jgi:antitoxin VapB